MWIQIYHINEFLFAGEKALKKAEKKLKQYQYSSNIASKIKQEKHSGII